MGFFRQEYRSELRFSFPGDLPDLGIGPGSPILQADSLPSEPPGKPNERFIIFLSHKNINFLRAGDFVYSVSPVSTTVLDV